MEEVTLIRLSKSAHGTFGIIVFDDQHLYTGELPWKNNKPNISCIPTGKHLVHERESPKYGRVYTVEVDGRSYILLHQGNYCGDESEGFKTHVRGCILLGMRTGTLAGQRAVLASRIARTRFERAMAFEPFILDVREAA